MRALLREQCDAAPQHFLDIACFLCNVDCHNAGLSTRFFGLTAGAKAHNQRHLYGESVCNMGIPRVQEHLKEQGPML